MKQIISTSNAPAAIGPYSQAVKAGNMLYVSGQLALDPASGELVGDDAAAQTRQALTNVKSILEAAGCSLCDVIKVTVLLQNIADFQAMNAVYAEFFEAECPARAAFEVAALPKGGLVEIEVIAYKE